ncbi:hypothetical protein K438DRAFT_1850746 [Mycena galopus ATCC 62051]|nr:hypothetical protein K438DRAFT_1850746 [Mycena galopus ATCC 62051]
MWAMDSMLTSTPRCSPYSPSSNSGFPHRPMHAQAPPRSAPCFNIQNIATHPWLAGSRAVNSITMC